MICENCFDLPLCIYIDSSSFLVTFSCHLFIISFLMTEIVKKTSFYCRCFIFI